MPLLGAQSAKAYMAPILQHLATSFLGCPSPGAKGEVLDTRLAMLGTSIPVYVYRYLVKKPFSAAGISEENAQG